MIRADYEKLEKFCLDWVDLCSEWNLSEYGCDYVEEILLRLEIADHSEQALELADRILKEKAKLLEVSDNKLRLLKRKGKSLSFLGRDFEALAHFQTLRSAYPSDPEIYYEIAEICFSAGYLDDCERACSRCLQLDPLNSGIYVIKGLLSLRQDQEDTAMEFLMKAVEIEPDNPLALNELSYLKHLKGEDDIAYDLVNRAIAESPDYADAICTKGTILFYRGEFEKAIACFEKSLRIMPDNAIALAGKGNSLVQLCEYEQASYYLDQALKLDPMNVDACHGKVLLYTFMGLESEASEWQKITWQIENELGYEG